MTRKEPFHITSSESRKRFHKIDMFTYNMFRCSILLCVLGYSVNSVAFPSQESYIPCIHFIYATETHKHKSWDLVAEIVFCNSFWSRIHQCENMPGRSAIRSSSVFIHFLVWLWSRINAGVTACLWFAAIAVEKEVAYKKRKMSVCDLRQHIPMSKWMHVTINSALKCTALKRSMR